MKYFFAKLVIITLILTAPLSFTGDVCPDFKPDCTRRILVDKAGEISVSHYRTTPRRSTLPHTPRLAAYAANSLRNDPYTSLFHQFLKDATSGRAPPVSCTASA